MVQSITSLTRKHPRSPSYATIIITPHAPPPAWEAPSHCGLYNYEPMYKWRQKAWKRAWRWLKSNRFSVCKEEERKKDEGKPKIKPRQLCNWCTIFFFLRSFRSPIKEVLWLHSTYITFVNARILLTELVGARTIRSWTLHSKWLL